MNKILIAVDLQNDFIDGSLGTPEAQRMLPAAVEYIREKAHEGYNVLYTMDRHNVGYLETNEGRHLPVEHCIYPYRGWHLNKDVSFALRSARATAVYKTSFGSYFDLPNLVLRCLSNQEERCEIQLLGLCTDICVISNALILKSRFPEADIKVVEHCCAGTTPEKHNAAIEVMRSCQIDII